MNKTTYKKRLDKIDNQKDKAVHPRDEFDIKLFVELAEDGVISAETLAKIYDQESKENAFECFTKKELRRFLYLVDPERREENKKNSMRRECKNLLDVSIEDMEWVDKLIGKYQ